jgi:hypothetical protein
MIRRREFITLLGGADERVHLLVVKTEWRHGKGLGTLATRLRLTPSSKLDKSQPTDGELPVA